MPSILITGASAGIGSQLAREFAARGYALALTARRLDALQALRAELQARHPGLRVEVRALDVCDVEQVAAVMQDLDQALGGLDVVVANAGIAPVARVGAGELAAQLQTLRTNVEGAVATVDAAVALMKPRGRGQVVGISSVAAFSALPKLGAYCASKAALSSYMECLRRELRGTGLSVTVLHPGFIDTDLNRKAKSRPFLVSLEQGGAIAARLIERRVADATVPSQPWGAIRALQRLLPRALLRRLS
ncbi:hypothetical protein HNQ51_001338 [Inhella inkyongensis]|uniref:Ketoreductase domain-containing protein n=1 Tax=Inhella inkyongensis TaxID=392593 RepID=A0A840S189_9BURK|nr:SDR family oxidoreductase [Inhella inkyongensis]MBB5204045.1 hypothetical protein [Inhella inkyongensis]